MGKKEIEDAVNLLAEHGVDDVDAKRNLKTNITAILNRMEVRLVNDSRANQLYYCLWPSRGAEDCIYKNYSKHCIDKRLAGV